MKKITIKIDAPKHRDYDHYLCQVKGLMRTKVIKNKKKELKKFNVKKELSYYSNAFVCA